MDKVGADDSPNEQDHSHEDRKSSHNAENLLMLLLLTGHASNRDSGSGENDEDGDADERHDLDGLKRREVKEIK
jgi:hypothetical protein